MGKDTQSGGTVSSHGYDERSRSQLPSAPPTSHAFSRDEDYILKKVVSLCRKGTQSIDWNHAHGQFLFWAKVNVLEGKASCIYSRTKQQLIDRFKRLK